MNRRYFLKVAAAIPALSIFLPNKLFASVRHTLKHNSRVRPGGQAWPSAQTWETLKQSLEGQLIKLDSPFTSCANTSCDEIATNIKNSFYLGDNPAMTQTSGWVDAWVSQPSAYAVAAKKTADIVAAVNFAREYNLRLVIKGGGHSYQGTSDSSDSLLIWTRNMNDITLHREFVAQGCEESTSQPAVTIGAGAMWIDAYNSVTTIAGRYVQGGGCATVGVAGLVQSGGFGNFSKNYGTAAAGLIEAEVVTADGEVRIANAKSNPDLFWALKGGGGGSFGVVTKLTLRTHELPEFFGAVFGKIKASSDASYKILIAKIIEFYEKTLFNPHWGEQIVFNSDNSVNISMVFQGLSQQQAEMVWTPFIDWVNTKKAYSFTKAFQTIAIPAQQFWNGEYYNQHFPGLMVSDPRPGTPKHHALWGGDQGETGWFIHNYKSAWIPASLIAKNQQSRLTKAVFNSTRHWQVSFHFNKGLAGASDSEIEAARNTAMNPAVLDAFALAIIAGGGPPEFPGMPKAPLDLKEARDNAKKITKAMQQLLKAAPNAGSYISESDYFKSDWQQAFWGINYQRLAKIKDKYDPDGLFYIHHGVNSEGWSENGFKRLGG